MDPVSPIPAIAVAITAFATAFILTKVTGASQAPGRFVSIDGLRGYLALSVFLHHSCIWYFFLRTGQWRIPPSNLYTYFGQGSVALFFMITGFLFFTKLLDGKKSPIDWPRLYIGRILRLTPLYLFAILLLFVITAHLSGGTLNQSLGTVLMDSIRWLTFTIFGAPNLNGVNNTSVIVAGVT